MTTTRPDPLVLGARVAELWTRAYTSQLSAETATSRRDEIAADLHDHLADARRFDTSPGATSRAIATRMLLGVPADLSWRHHHLREERRAVRKENAMARPVPEHRARLASLAGILVVCWVLFVGVASGVGSAVNGWPVAWVSVGMIVGVMGIAILGLARLLRGRTDGAFLLAAAAIGSTLWFVWFPIIPLVGVGFAVGLVVYGVRARRPSPAAQQVAG